MKNEKPKGRTPSLIGSTNGRPKRADVKRKSECCRCNDDIGIGADCFNIPKAGMGFSKECRYCKDCYGKVLDQTQKDLDGLKTL